MSKPQTNNTYADIVTELQRSFDFFVKYYKLDETLYHNAMITLMPAGRRQAYGWYCSDSWEDKTGHRTEINLSAEYLNRSIEEIMVTLLHEMAHLKNAIAGIKDCDPTNQYHNKEFKKTAEFFGLEVSKLPPKGWAKTVAGDVAKDAISKLKPDESVYSIYRVPRKKLRQVGKKYLAIFVDDKYGENLDRACDKLGKNKKQVVEAYLEKF